MSARALPAARDARFFFPAMGLAVAVVVFAGFARTYYLAHWLTPPSRMPPMTPLIHVHGRIHPVWTWGGGMLVASQLARVAVMHSAPWLAFAHWVAVSWPSR